jgi:predicted hydrocarbon binding protein
LLPTHFFRLFLETLDAELGPKTLAMVLEKADLDPALIDPQAVSHLTSPAAAPASPAAAPASPAPGQAETYAHIQHALRVYYGRGARGTLVRIGRILWIRLLETASLPEKAQAQLARSLPTGQRLKAILELLARFMRERNADVSVHTLDLDLLLVDSVGAATIGQKENAPVCIVTLGLIQEALIWVSGHEYDVEEVSCRAAGGDACEFKITVSGK